MGYVLIGGVKSRAFRVLWMLEELGVPYDHVPAKPHSKAVLDVSSSGKVPVLLDGQKVIHDSSAILTYLADKHGALTALAGSVARAQQDAWTFRILDDVESALWTASKHSFILPQEERVPEVKSTCKAEYERAVAAIMDEMTGPYLTGDQISVPDLILCHCGGWAAAAKFPVPNAAFGEYLGTMRARPAFKAAQARGAE